MKYLMGLFLVLFSVIVFADSQQEITGAQDENVFYSIYYSPEKADPVTYREAVKFCTEDGDNYWIPHLELLLKVIVVAELQHLNRWFWSSTEALDEECSDDSCHYQAHAKTLERRARDDETLSAYAFCVSF